MKIKSKIGRTNTALLSSGEFVGMVADDPHQKMKLKSFHCEILNDKDALHSEEKYFKELPEISKITQEMVLKNYYRIKQEVEDFEHGINIRWKNRLIFIVHFYSRVRPLQKCLRQTTAVEQPSFNF